MKTTFGVIFALLSLSASAQGPFGRSVAAGTFHQLGEITGTLAGDDFGYSVAVSGNTLVVGAPLASDDFCGNCGAAYVYTAVNGDWTNLMQVAILTQKEAGLAGGFGNAVAISGDTIVVAGFDATLQQSIACVYVNPSGTSTETAKLTISDSNGGGGINAVAIDGGVIVVGTPSALVVGHEEGAAFVYVEPPTGWVDMSQTAELVSKNLDTFFGGSVAISGRNVLVGAIEVPIGGVEQGAAYLFLEPAAGWSGTWGPTTEFEASNGTRKAEFGPSVSASGDTVAVGAPGETVGSSQNKGAVYIFTRPLTGWPKTMTETADLTASTAKGGAELGFSVVLSGKTLVAGAPFARGSQGLVYLFSEPPGGWQTTSSAREINASDGVANDNFGWSVAFSGVIAAGAPQLSGITVGDGAAYVFGSNSQ